MLLIILLVCFVVVMLLWLLALLRVIPTENAHPWLSFFAVLIVGIVVFLVGNGVVTVMR